MDESGAGSFEHLDETGTITIPLRRPADLDRVGRVANVFATALARSIEVVTVIDPNDDLALEFARFSKSVELFAQREGVDVQLRVIAKDRAQEAVLETCRDRLVCMTTGASPFDDAHYVGSFAALLLSESTAPVILVGPGVDEEVELDADRVVLAISDDVDSSASQGVAHAFAVALDRPIGKIRVDAEKGIIYETDCHDPAEWFPEHVHASMRSDVISEDEISDVLLQRSEGGLLVLATRAHRGLAWICDGSVAFDAIAHTSLPIVVVGPKAGEVDASVDSDRPSHEWIREVFLQAPTAEAAIEELDERLRFVNSADAVRFTASGA
jgi:nucleotide-binding universal stress UspA family protein